MRHDIQMLVHTFMRHLKALLAPLLLLALPASAEPFISWSNLKNPVIHPDMVTQLTGRETNSLKDAAMYYHDESGYFYFFFSDFYSASDLVGIKSRDLKSFELVLDHEDGCSPDLVKYGDTFYITYQTGYGYDPPEYPGKTIWYLTSTDLESWSEPNTLAPNLTDGYRSIDAAASNHAGTYYLAFKRGSDPYIAKASSIASPAWEGLGYAQGGWAENYQFIQIDGKWYAVVTAKMGDEKHSPVIVTLMGDPGQDAHWTDWSERRRLALPGENWNPEKPHNAVYLADWRRYDGYFYAIYCGQDDCCRGNYGFRLGLARSPDLKTWYVPGDTGGETKNMGLKAPYAPLFHKLKTPYTLFDLSGRTISYGAGSTVMKVHRGNQLVVRSSSNENRILRMWKADR